MTDQDTNFPEIENVGKIERGLRGAAGLAMIGAVLLIPSLSESALASLSMLSIYTVFTAITGWDPIYALMRKSQQQPTPFPPTVAVHQHKDAPHASDDYKKAA